MALSGGVDAGHHHEVVEAVPSERGGQRVGDDIALQAGRSASRPPGRAR